ncbi:MAG: hypothetical protein ACYSUB_01765 [Planctomycetota bacterium]|jgi:hypothetical protein
MVAVTKLDKLSRRLPVVHNCRHVLQELGNNPTVSAIQEWINRLGASADLVWNNRECLTVSNLLKALNEKRSAILVPLQFVGGPPKGRGLLKVYKGSLYTFLLDRILYYIEEVGLEATESVLDIRRKGCSK